MQESPYRKIAIPIIFLSLLMLGISALKWYQARHQVHTLILATANPTGEYYAFGQALAKIVEKHNPKLQIKVISSEGTQQNIQWIQERKADLAIVQSDTHWHPFMRTVSFLFPEAFHLIVNQSSDIKSINDLKRKKVALMPKKSGSYPLFWMVSQHYGLKNSELQTFPLPLDQAIAQLKQGEVDGFFTVIALGNPKITELLQNPQLNLVSIDQGAALQLFLPYLEATQIPKGTYNGEVPIPREDLSTVGVRSLLITHKRVNKDIIHEITRILYEHRNELIEENIHAAMISSANSVNNLGFPLHSGAAIYYNKDKPLFIVQYAESLSLGVSLTVLLASGLWQLRMWLQGKQKNRADSYNLELVELIHQIHQAESLEQLEQIRGQLLNIFEKVINDLDKDRISSDSFQSFQFPCEVALTTLRHQEILLKGGQLSR